MRKLREAQRKQELADRAVLEEQRAAQRESDRKERIRLKKQQKQAAAQDQANAAAAAAAAVASGTGSSNSRSAKGRASAAAAAAPPVASKPSKPACVCGCNDWQQHPFKKTDCANCFHPHAAS